MRSVDALRLTGEITGEGAWKRGGLTAADWLVPVTDRCLAELDDAISRWHRGPQPVETLDPVAFDLGACRELMGRVRRKLDGAGLAVVDRIPVERYAEADNRAIGWLLARTLGQVVGQKWDGVRLYDVKDSGQALGYGVRRSVTNLGQPFHTDGGWLSLPPAYVGLFCLESAGEGGVSRFASLVTAHNEMRRRHPDRLDRLYRPFWWDRQAEHAPGDPPVAARPVFAFDGRDLVARYYEEYVLNGQRLAGEPLDAEARDALTALREIVDDPEHWVEFRIERGQFQYLQNRLFAHSRTGFLDTSTTRRRHMVRFWNRDEGTPHLEGQLPDAPAARPSP
ncbi:MAG: TauD/TfdA family dioxygenase [Candidatus Rokubacteria bacterium]|nr:TauD/TfdA family dioxygenase [Candidatus Rokubacteria bacterium]